MAMHFLTCEQTSLSWLELSEPKASVELSPLPSAYGARLRDQPRVHVADDRVDVGDVVVGHHDHVDAGGDGVRHLERVRGVGELLDAAPVADHEALEALRPLEHGVDQVAVAVVLDPVPAVVGDHQRTWWAGQESNPRPSRCKRDALTS
jgi:hypothetical protein